MSWRKGLLAVVLLLFGAALYAQTADVRCVVVPENPRPGEPVTIGLNDSAGARSAVLTMDGRRLSRSFFFSVPAEGGKPAFLATVLTVPATAKPGGAVITLQGDAGAIGEFALNIADRDFVSEVIELNAALTGIRADPDPQKTAESEHLWAILSRTGRDSFHFGTFRPPVTATRRTSFFGDRRVYKYSNGNTDTSIHAGIDYGVPTGTPVTACGAGRVVLARYRIVTGNSVVIEHLPGVYSLYYHLSSIDIAEGAQVIAGRLLGQSGATGLATGPHLHWEIRVFGENTDPDAFISRPILDKDAILSRISQ